MKLYIDSANVKLVEKYAKMKIFTGVTTTPTFFRREGIKDIEKEIRKISRLIPNGEVHIEAMGSTSEEIIKNAEKNMKMGKNIVSKIPLNPESATAVKYLSERGIKTNVHLIFSLNQAMIASLAGATYVCPLLGRLYDIGHDGFRLVEEIITSFRRYPEIKTKVMVSSVRSPDHVKQSALIGADIVTIPPNVCELMFQHPLTTLGVDKFEEDITLTKSVGDLMHYGPDFPMVEENIGMKETIIEMTKKKLGFVVVVDKKGKLVGCISDGDLRRAIQRSPNIFKLKAKDCMTKNPKTINEDRFAYEALALMEKHSITSLIITNEHQEPYGLIHIHDILEPRYIKYLNKSEGKH
ncbi:MAG: transaldolase family protein [Candidatus Thermoplasmatota archaeon]